MDTLRMMLFALLIGATASTSAYAPATDAATAPPAATSVQQGTQADWGLPDLTFVTPFPAPVTPAPTPKPTATARVIDTGTSITRELYRGLEGDDVRMLQKLLDDLGYSASIDGTFGVQTRNAVIQFQRNNGLKADGIAGTRTIRKLVSKDAVRGDAEVKPRTSLSYGMTGQDVLNLQTRLAELGYYADICSGKYLTNTRSAVRWFQQNNGLAVDGIAGPATLSRVYSHSAIPAGMPQPTPGPVFSRALYQGLSGADVTLLQQFLYDLGYLPIRPTGFFGNDTYLALQTYQTYNGLYADGIAGQATFDLLLSGRSIPYYPGPTGTPRPKPTNTHYPWPTPTPTSTPTPPPSICSYCQKAIVQGEEWMHTTLTFCGVHRICEGGSHEQCINCKRWSCDADFPPACDSDPDGRDQHVFR